MKCNRSRWTLTVLSVLGLLAFAANAQLNPQCTYRQAQALAIESCQYDMNWLHPGCGTGMEAAFQANDKLDRVIHRHPELLTRLLQDGSEKARGFALLKIGWERIPEYGDRLAGILRSDKDENCREFAAAALGRLGAKPQARALRAALKDRALLVRVTACAALLTIGESVDMAFRNKLNREAKSKFGANDISLVHVLQRE